MANKKTKKKNAQASSAPSTVEPKKAEAKKADAKKGASAKANASTKKDAKAKKSKKDAKAKNAKPGLFTRAKRYLGSIRTEMKRVVWPSKKELVNYSVAVIISLIVVGVVIALLDTVISEGLVLFSGLRG